MSVIRLVWRGNLMAIVLVPLALSIVGAPATAPPEAPVPSLLPAPPGHSDPVAGVAAMSCNSLGNCTAVGGYDDSSGSSQGLLWTQTSGTWGAGVEAALPAGAGAHPYVELSSVSCASPGNCSAVGRYLDSGDNLQGVLINQISGTWAAGVQVSAPNGAGPDPYVELSSVSCASPGDCSAVGTYTDSSHEQQGLLLTETSGTWGTGTQVALPPGGTRSSLSSVSCPSTGNCEAVGFYADAAGNLQAAMVTESSGTWATATTAVLPAGPRRRHSRPSRAHRLATAARSVSTPTLRTTAILSSSASPLGPGQPRSAVTLPDPSKVPNADLFSVSCAAPGDCTAGGFYFDPYGNEQGLVVTESAGV